MDLYVLDSNYTPIAVIDAYKSLIWTKRYYTCGDFELYVPADRNLLQYLQPDNFITREDDDSVMVIEKLEIKTDAENGDFFIVSGRSLESILLRRIFKRPVTISVSDPIQGIKALIDACTADEGTGTHVQHWRNITNLVVDDSFSIEETLKAQFTGDTLLDAISSIAMRFGFGFKMTISNSQFVLSFYQGEEIDVVFSPEFDNLINSNYVYDKTNFANYVYVAGEGEGNQRRGHGELRYDLPTDEHYYDPLGIALREVYVDARDLSSNNGEIDGIEYGNLLGERANEKFSDCSITKTFEAEIEPRASFKYKEDYNLGDIVEVTTEYGVTAHPRITEIIESWDETGYTVVPTFEELEVE